MLKVQKKSSKRPKQLSLKHAKKVNNQIKHNSYSKLVRRSIKHYHQRSSQQLASSTLSTTPLFFDTVPSLSSPTSMSSLCDHLDTSSTSLFTSTVITRPYSTSSSFSHQHQIPSHYHSITNNPRSIRSNHHNHYHNHANHFNTTSNHINFNQTYRHNINNRSNILHNQSLRSFSTSQSTTKPPNVINIDPMKFSYHRSHKSTNNIDIHFYFPNNKNHPVLASTTISMVNDLVSQQIDPIVDELLTVLYNQDSNDNDVGSKNDPINRKFLNKFSTFKAELAEARKMQQPLPKVLAKLHPRFGRLSSLSTNQFNSNVTFETTITQQFLDDLLTLLMFTIEYDFLFPFKYDENGNRIEFTPEQKKEISKAFQFHFFQQIRTGQPITIDDCVQDLIRILAEAGIGKSVALCRIVPILIKICNIKKVPFLISFDSFSAHPMQLYFEPSSTPTSNDHYFHFYFLQRPIPTAANPFPTIPLEELFQYIQPNSIHLYERRDYQRAQGSNIHEVFQDLYQSMHSTLTKKRKHNSNFKCLTTIVSSTPRALQLQPVLNYSDVPAKSQYDLYEPPEDEDIHPSSYGSSQSEEKQAPPHFPFKSYIISTTL